MIVDYFILPYVRVLIMAPGTRADGRSGGGGRGRGGGRGIGLPAMHEYLAQLINQHITASIRQHLDIQNLSRGSGCGIPGGDVPGT
jgi:hypothetical protein